MLQADNAQGIPYQGQYIFFTQPVVWKEELKLFVFLHGTNGPTLLLEPLEVEFCRGARWIMLQP